MRFFTKFIFLKTYFSLFAFILASYFSASYSQENTDIDPSMLKASNELAPVKMDGVTLFYVRGVSAYPAQTRATSISKRIRKAAGEASIPVDSIKVLDNQGRWQVFAGKEFIMNVYPEDAEVEGISINVLIEIVKGKLSDAITSYREERAYPVIKSGIWRALVVLVLSLGVYFLFHWASSHLKGVFTDRLKNRAEKLSNISFKLIQAEQLIAVLRTLFTLFKSIISIIFFVAVVEYLLSLFPWTKGFSAYILQIILDPLQQMGLGFLNYLPKLIFLVIIYLITRYILKLVRLFFNGIQNGAIVLKSFFPEWAMSAFQITRFLIVVLAVVMAFPYIPFSDTSAFQGISVFLGLIFSLGSSSFVSNIIAGYSLTFRRVFNIGDRILVNDTIGTVESQTLMVTRIRSVKNEEIIIPNSALINSTVLNYSKKANDPGIILHTTVGIGYETPWRQVDAMLKMAAYRTEGLLKDPPPYVLQKELADYAVTYEINVYCNDPSKILYYYTQLHQNILDVFNEYNVQIMTPSYVADPAIPKVVPKQDWNMPPAGEK